MGNVPSRARLGGDASHVPIDHAPVEAEKSLCNLTLNYFLVTIKAEAKGKFRVFMKVRAVKAHSSKQASNQVSDHLST